jgi:hypothetical protein
LPWNVSGRLWSAQDKWDKETGMNLSLEIVSVVRGFVMDIIFAQKILDVACLHCLLHNSVIINEVD